MAVYLLRKLVFVRFAVLVASVISCWPIFSNVPSFRLIAERYLRYRRRLRRTHVLVVFPWLRTVYLPAKSLVYVPFAASLATVHSCLISTNVSYFQCTVGHFWRYRGRLRGIHVLVISYWLLTVYVSENLVNVTLAVFLLLDVAILLFTYVIEPFGPRQQHILIIEISVK